MAEDRTGVGAQLDALEAAHKGATAGPWIQSVHTDGQPIVAGDFDGESCTDLAYVPDSPADAAAIVAEHNAFPDLIAVARGVLALADAADEKVRQSVPAAGAERLIAEGAHTVKVADLRATVAAALGEA